MKISYEKERLMVGLDRVEKFALKYGRAFKTEVNGYNLRLQLADAGQRRSAADFVNIDGESKPFIDAYFTAEALDSQNTEVDIKPLNGKKPEFSKIILHE